MIWVEQEAAEAADIIRREEDTAPAEPGEDTESVAAAAQAVQEAVWVEAVTECIGAEWVHRRQCMEDRACHRRQCMEDRVCRHRQDADITDMAGAGIIPHMIHMTADMQVVLWIYFQEYAVCCL